MKSNFRAGAKISNASAHGPHRRILAAAESAGLFFAEAVTPPGTVRRLVFDRACLCILVSRMPSERWLSLPLPKSN
jgi:hypothetical protein